MTNKIYNHQSAHTQTRRICTGKLATVYQNVILDIILLLYFLFSYGFYVIFLFFLFATDVGNSKHGGFKREESDIAD